MKVTGSCTRPRALSPAAAKLESTYHDYARV